LPFSLERMSPLRVAVADDSVLLREGLVRVLGEAGLDVVGSYGDADTLLAALPDLALDAVVLDVRMPPTFRDEGVQAALSLRRQHPGVAILLLSQYVELTYAHELLAAGSAGLGYLLKDRVISLDDVRDALHRIVAGGTVLDPEVVSQLMARRVDPLAALTPRERDVLELMAQGRTNAAIAQALFIGVGAVEKNVSAIFAKLGLDDTGEDHRRVLAVVTYLHNSG